MWMIIQRAHTLIFVCVCVCRWKQFSVLRIKPQKMFIRVDLGTRSERLMDRVQGQTSPGGAIILSLIVHAHTHAHTHIPSSLLTPPPPHHHQCSLTLLYTHHRQNKSVSDTTGEKKRRRRGAFGSKGEEA